MFGGVAPRVAGLAALVLVPAATPAPSGAAAPQPATFASATSAAAGSGRGGDGYFPLDGNGGYDVSRYRISVRVDPRSGFLRGRTRVTARAEQRLRSFHLDLALRPDSVRVGGARAQFSKPNAHELVVRPRTAIASGSRFTVVVRYHGYPASTKAAGLRPFFHEAGEALAMGQPQIGAWWFPANETPEDKANFDVSVSVPKGQQAISNGRLVSRRSKAGWTRWHWRNHEPTTTYLAFFAAGRYDLERGTVDGRAYTYAVSKELFPDERDTAMQLLRRTRGVVRWLSAEFGPYPFESTGGVVTSIATGFALENQTRPVYPYVGGPWNADNILLLVHENAHQWFGNDVAVRRWRDVWLNEGFASYAEWRYREAKLGLPVSQQLMDSYHFHAPSSAFWKLRISNPGPVHMWDAPVYERGAMTLAALRNLVGATDLDRLLTEWVARHHDGNGTSGAFRRLAERVSGQQLDSFFQAWLDTPSRPEPTEANGLS